MGFSQLHATRAHRNTKKSITYVHRQFHRPYRPHSIIFLIVILCLWFFFFYHSSRTHGALTDVNRFLCIRFLFNYTNTKINGAYYSRNINIFRISVHCIIQLEIYHFSSSDRLPHFIFNHRRHDPHTANWTNFIRTTNKIWFASSGSRKFITSL